MKRLKNYFKPLLSVFLILIITASGLTVSAADTEGFIKIANSGAPKTIDPASDGIMLTENAGIYETLIGSSSNFDWIPNLASSWKQTGDTTWEFTIRDGVTFHDGKPLTAEAVKISLDHAASINPKVKKMLKYDSCETKGDKTVIIKTTENNAMLPAFLHYPNTAIFSPDAIDGSGTVTKAIGTGIMKVRDFNAQTGTITLEKNPNWWGGEVATPGIILSNVPDPNTRALAIENKEVDITHGIAPSEASRLNGVEGLSVQMYDTPRLIRLDCNLAHPVMADVNVRKAISYAIDRTSLADDVMFGAATPAAGVFTPNVPWANQALTPYAFDPEKSKLLLDEAGYKDTDNDGIREKDGTPMELTLISDSGSATLPPLAEAIADNLKSIGIKVNVELMEYGAVDAKMKTGNWDLHFRSFSTGMAPDPGYVMNNWYTTDGSDNYAGYSNPVVDEKVKSANTVSEQSQRFRAYDEVQQIVYNELPLIPVLYPKFIMVMSDKVKGFVYDSTAHDYRINPGTHL